MSDQTPLITDSYVNHAIAFVITSGVAFLCWLLRKLYTLAEDVAKAHIQYLSDTVGEHKSQTKEQKAQTDIMNNLSEQILKLNDKTDKTNDKLDAINGELVNTREQAHSDMCKYGKDKEGGK